MSTESNQEVEDETVLRLEHMSDMMISEVCSNPAYAQCLLHIKAYRNYHKEEREEFKERIDVLDDRYSRYTSITDAIQILIITLSAGSAFVQAGNQIFSLQDSTVQFMGLCVSSWTALTLAISKYYKLDEQKEKMNSLRQQCAELMSELGAREDRLNTLCSKEIWAGPPGAPLPPALAAWVNERDEMYNNLKTIIQKKQSLVNDFDYLLDSNESKNLIMRAKSRTLRYKKEKLLLTKQYTEYEKVKKQAVKEREAIIGKPKKRRLADMASHQPASQYTAISSVSPGVALKQSGRDNVILGVRENEILRSPSHHQSSHGERERSSSGGNRVEWDYEIGAFVAVPAHHMAASVGRTSEADGPEEQVAGNAHRREALRAPQPEVLNPRVGQLLCYKSPHFFENPADPSNSEIVRVSGIQFENGKIIGYTIARWSLQNYKLVTNNVYFIDEQASYYHPISSYNDVGCDIYFEDELVMSLPGRDPGTPVRMQQHKICSYDSQRKYGIEDNKGNLASVSPTLIFPSSPLIDVLENGHHNDNIILSLPEHKKLDEKKTQNSKKNVRFSEENYSDINNATFCIGDRVEHRYPNSLIINTGTIRCVNEDGTYGICNDHGVMIVVESNLIHKLRNNDIESGLETINEDSEGSIDSNRSADTKEEEELKDGEEKKSST